MEFSRNLRTLRRSLGLATGVIRAKLDSPLDASPPLNSRLVAFEGFGDNPGKLRMLAHVPASTKGRPLVVLLHGCGQDAARFANDTGWAALADRLRFPLILPQQAEANNASRCFQWFHPSDTTRDQGEAGSIAAMTRAAISRFDCDPRRVFVLGLSAGGAMTAALLAAYPDVFAAGACVAGLPVGAARSGIQALLRMASAGVDQPAEAWAAHIRGSAPAGFSGPWPRLSIWHGAADTTVAPQNAWLLADQWRALHRLPSAAATEQISGHINHRFWAYGRQRILEVWSLQNLQHAYPVGNRSAAPGRFIEPAEIDATAAIARFFGLD